MPHTLNITLGICFLGHDHYIVVIVIVFPVNFSHCDRSYYYPHQCRASVPPSLLLLLTQSVLTCWICWLWFYNIIAMFNIAAGVTAYAGRSNAQSMQNQQQLLQQLRQQEQAAQERVKRAESAKDASQKSLLQAQQQVERSALFT